MWLGLGKLTQTIITPVQLQLASQIRLDSFGLEWGTAKKIIISPIPLGRPDKVGLMGLGQIELDLWGLGCEDLQKP